MDDTSYLEIQQIKPDAIKLRQGEVIFNEYQLLLDQAKNINTVLKRTIITEENIKENKKLVAQVSKSIKELDRRRIEIKEFLNEPYKDFENQLKEIKGIVQEGEKIVRDQIRELEQKEKELKYQQILERFQERIQKYQSEVYVFDKFMQPEYLNKSYSMKKIDKKIGEFINTVNNDLEFIDSQPAEIRDALVNEYVNSNKSVIECVNLIKERKREERRQHDLYLERERAKEEKLMENDQEVKTYQWIYSITLYNKDEFEQTERYLDDHGIVYSTCEEKIEDNRKVEKLV